jgi:hypothetical protein
MYPTDTDELRNRLNRFISVVDTAYIEALILLQKNLETKHVEWAVGGDLAEALEAIQVEPDCIEIVTSKEGAEQIFLVTKQFGPQPIEFLTVKLDRNAVINGIQRPIFLRSYFFDFFMGCVHVKVYGDMQYKINDWDWGDKLEFIPEHVNVTGAKIAVVPLQVKYEIYQKMGWAERAEKIEPIIRRRMQKPS